MNPLIKTLTAKFFLTEVLFMAGMGFSAALCNANLNGHGTLEILLGTAIACGGVVIFWLLLLWLWAGEVDWTGGRKALAFTGLCIALALMPIGLIADNVVVICLPINIMLAMLVAWLPWRGEPAAKLNDDAPPRPRLFTWDVGLTLLCGLIWTPLIHLFLLLDEIYNRSEHMSLLIVSLTSVAIWMLVWLRRVRWTPRRASATLAAAIAALGAEAFAFALSADSIADWNIPGFMAATLFVIATAWLWQSSRAEREAARLNDPALKNLGETVFCPECGFNLTGLELLRCPECGRQYTLGRLLYENLRLRRLDMQLDLE